MGPGPLSIYEFGDLLFPLCVAEQTGFVDRFNDVAERFGFLNKLPDSAVDCRELIVAYVWLMFHVLQAEGKTLDQLRERCIVGLRSHHKFCDFKNTKDITNFLERRSLQYERVAQLSASRVDLVDVCQPISRNVFRAWPEMEPHLPRLGMIMNHLMTEWVVSVVRTIDELKGSSSAAEKR